MNLPSNWHHSASRVEKGAIDVISKFKSLIANKSGATAIEYGLIAALVSVAAVVALQNLGSSLNSMFTTVSTELNTAVAAAGGP